MKIGAISKKTTLLALVGTALGVLPSVAQNVPKPAQGDILIGFRQGLGSYLVNVGSASKFVSAGAGSTAVTGLGSIAADLADYNTTRTINAGEENEEVVPVAWHERGDLFWGAIGVYSSANVLTPAQQDTVYVSRARFPISVQSEAWKTLGSGPFNTTITSFSSVIHGGGYPTLPQTVNSPVGAKQPTTVDPGISYAKRAGAPGGGGFEFFSGFEASFNGGAANSALDLYQITRNPSTVTYLGYFTITSSGQISFNKQSAASTDTDGDGFSDEIETLTGTSPTDGSDFFKAEVLSHDSTNGSAIQFKGVAGRTYSIQYSATLGNDWLPIHDIPVTTAGLQNWTDSNPDRKAAAKGFYRIVVALTAP